MASKILIFKSKAEAEYHFGRQWSEYRFDQWISYDKLERFMLNHLYVRPALEDLFNDELKDIKEREDALKTEKLNKKRKREEQLSLFKGMGAEGVALMRFEFQLREGYEHDCQWYGEKEADKLREHLLQSTSLGRRYKEIKEGNMPIKAEPTEDDSFIKANTTVWTPTLEEDKQ